MGPAGLAPTAPGTAIMTEPYFIIRGALFCGLAPPPPPPVFRPPTPRPPPPLFDPPTDGRPPHPRLAAEASNEGRSILITGLMSSRYSTSISSMNSRRSAEVPTWFVAGFWAAGAEAIRSRYRFGHRSRYW